jgi:hypothetical protein
MIKKFWTMLLSVVMALTILPAMVYAGESAPLNTVVYDLWVDGTQVTSENAENVLGDGTVSYDVESNTLTLNNTEIDTPYTSSDYYTSGIYSAGDINITLTGDNSINISGGMIAAGIHANGVITISGSGSLDLTVSGGSSETRAIATGYTDGEAGVVINSGTITIDADGTSGIYAVNVDGSYGTALPNRYFRINGGTVEMDANSTSPYSCYATNIKPDLSGYEGYSATAILNSWEELQSYNENSWGYYRYIKVQPLVYDENGISEDKEHFQPAQQASDGYYEIKNAGNLFWFAEKLTKNADNDTLNARLVSNITMPEEMNWVAMQVGPYGTPYNGTFDGAGYTISNLSAELEAGVFNNEGLFKTIGENGVVKNLGMINASIKPSSGYAGAICGTNYGLIENCYNLGGEISANYTWAGGIAGENDGTIKRCYNTGTVTSTGSSIGGIAGYSHDGGEIIDCYNTGDITGQWYVGGICGELNGGTVENCYGTGTATATYPGYDSTANPVVGGRLNSYTVENTYYINLTENNNGGKTEEQFASGEVTWLLNCEKSEGVWKQTIGTDGSPNFTGSTVYKGYSDCGAAQMTYSNSEMPQEIPDHDYDAPVWNWSADKETATAVFVCKNDASHTHTENASVTSQIKTPATCTEKGVTAYTATVLFNGKEYTATQNVTNIPMIAHNYHEGICTVCGKKLEVVIPDNSDSSAQFEITIDENAKSELVVEVGKIVDEIMTGGTTSAVSDDVAQKVYEAVNDGQEIVTVIEYDDTIVASKAEKAEMQKLLAKNDEIGVFFDLSVLLKVNGETIGNITTLSKPIVFTMTVPEDLVKTGRTFYIIRIHNGSAEKLEAVFNSENNTLTFETDKFSTYALAYTDSVNNTDNETTEVPQTGDDGNAELWFVLIVIAACGLTGTIAYSCRKNYGE